MPRGIFVTYRGHLDGPPGGVQVCTQEYVNIITAAGIELTFCILQGDRRFSTRVLRRINSSAYFRPAESVATRAIAQLAAQSPLDFVFFNQVALATLAPRVRQIVPANCKIVALSHGLESTDLLHFIRLRRHLPLRGHVRPTSAIALGRAILAESALRAHVDVICALSPFDADLERWIGAARVGWLPRIVEPRPIDWRPQGERLGFVGTLDHGPNLEGLVEVLDQLTSRDVGRLRLRIVGGPAATGRWLADRYPMVDYLGSADDVTLAEEASTWNAFIHPIFCHARGCSMKLAMAIAWQLPIITTTVGHRGYLWRAGELVVADDPSRYVDECLRLLDTEAAAAVRSRVGEVARSSPILQENVSRFLRILAQ